MIKFYKQFLTEKLHTIVNSIIQKNGKPKSLYQNYIDDELVCVIEYSNQIYMLVINTHKDGLFQLNIENSPNYTIFKKENLKNNVSPVTFKKLLKRGLYYSDYSGRNSNNNHFSLHRLIGCLRENITGKIIHHIDRNGFNNNAENLLAITKEEHDELHKENKNEANIG